MQATGGDSAARVIGEACVSFAGLVNDSREQPRVISGCKIRLAVQISPLAAVWILDDAEISDGISNVLNESAVRKFNP
jgi:hypothetical protein